MLRLSSPTSYLASWLSHLFDRPARVAQIYPLSDSLRLSRPDKEGAGLPRSGQFGYKIRKAGFLSLFPPLFHHPGAT